MSELTYTVYDNEAAWLANRRLGGSDAPVILGMSPYKSPYTLWAELRGLIEPRPMDADLARFGHLLEPVVCSEYERITGRTVVDRGRYVIASNSKYPWLTATLDREVDGISAGRGQDNGVLEAKNAGVYKAKEWVEQPPLDYIAQLQHQMAVTDYKWGSLAVLIGGNSFKFADIERNEEFISAYLKTTEAFWRMVQDNIEPRPDGSDSTATTVRRLYSDGDGSSVLLPPTAADWHLDYERAKSDLKDADKRKTQAANNLANAIGRASHGVLPQGLGSYYFTKSGKSRALRHKA